MDTPFGKPAESVKRFSLMKWAVAGGVLLLLALTWLGGPGPATESAGDGPGTGTDAGRSAAGPAPGGTSAATNLSLELAGDGSLKVGGVVSDETIRNQWLNEIRIGAQGRRVTDQLQVGPVAPTAADWTSHLSGLVAVMRERQLAGLRVEGDRVVLQGSSSDPAAKGETEKMIQAQLPGGYRVDSKLALGPTPDGAARASAPKPSPETAASQPAPGTVAPAQKEDGTPAAPAGGSGPRALAQNEATRESSEIAAKKPARKPVNCPRQLRPLAQPVYFKTDVATISAEDRSRLQRLGECLGRARVRIVGHADPRHTDDYNQELSERRAQAVADAMAAGGANPARITVVGAGKARPAAKGNSRAALQRSRRVDIQIR